MPRRRNTVNATPVNETVTSNIGELVQESEAPVPAVENQEIPTSKTNTEAEMEQINAPAESEIVSEDQETSVGEMDTENAAPAEINAPAEPEIVSEDRETLVGEMDTGNAAPAKFNENEEDAEEFVAELVPTIDEDEGAGPDEQNEFGELPEESAEEPEADITPFATGPVEDAPLSLRVDIQDNFRSEDFVATANVEINGIVTVRNVKIKQGDYELNVVMPRTKIPDTGRFRDACFFQQREMRNQFDLEVLNAYYDMGQIEFEEEPEMDITPLATGPAEDASLSLRVDIHNDCQSENIVATADVEINGIVTVRNVKIKQGDYGLDVIMPRTKMANTGRFRDTCFFQQREMRNQFDLEVLKAYQQVMGPVESEQESHSMGMRM